MARATMPLIYTHLIPATLDGRARMNVANALARGRGGVGGRRAPPRHPPGPAHVHDVLLPGARPAQRARRQGLQGGHRLLPQRRRHATADRVRRADDGRRPAGRANRRWGRRRRRASAGRRTGGRSASSASRATGATTTSASSARSRRGVRRDHRPRGREPARPRCRANRRERARRVRRVAASRGAGGQRRNEQILEELGRGARVQRAHRGDLVVICADDAAGGLPRAMDSRASRTAASRSDDPGRVERARGLATAELIRPGAVGAGVAARAPRARSHRRSGARRARRG